MIGTPQSSKKETSGVSTAPAIARSGGKPNAKAKKPARKVPPKKAADKAESQGARRGTFREADGQMSLGRFVEVLDAPAQGGSGKRLGVVLIREGLGNLGDCFFYTQSAIESAVPVFEGAQFYLDHPAEDEEVNRPERSVRDIAGYFENVRAERAPDGCTELKGDLVLVASPAFERERALMCESIEYSKKHQGKDLVGLSINASGDYEECEVNAFMSAYNVPTGAMQKLQEAIAQGMTIIRPTKEINSAVSCDLVTVAGAGGRISQLLERGKKMPTEAEVKALKEKQEKERLEADRKKKLEAEEAFEAEEGQEESEESIEESESDEASDGEGGEEPDADKDNDLIQGLLKKSMGDGFSDEHKQAAKEAYEKAKSMYPDDEKEAMRCAQHLIKAAFHQAAKGDAAPPAGVQPAESGKKESMRSEKDLAKVAAENAKLKTELSEFRLEKAIAAGLKEAKLPPAAEKSFRETLLKSVKTEEQFKEKLAMFQEALAAVPGQSSDDFIINPEKDPGESGGGEGSLTFDDCQIDD